MSGGKVILENCYTCSSCLVTKQICKKKNKPIVNIYKDKCADYSERIMMRCELCGNYVINLASHVSTCHNKTFNEYKILTRDKNSNKISFKRGALWD